MDPSNDKGPPYRPEGLTDEQFAQYQACSNNIDLEKEAAELLELLAHPETWVSIEDVLKELEANCGELDSAPDATLELVGFLQK